MPSKLLKDMRWVYDNPEAEPKSEARRKLQELFRDNFKEFSGRMEALEKTQVRTKSEVLPGPSTRAEGERSEVTDETEQRIEALITRLIAEARDGAPGNRKDDR